MKNIDEITRLSAEDLDRIGQDASVQVPDGFKVSLPGRSRTVWAVAASVAILLGVGLWTLPKPPKDTFDDPYLAYAAIEQALGRVGDAIALGASKVEAAEVEFDKISYWK